MLFRIFVTLGSALALLSSFFPIMDGILISMPDCPMPRIDFFFLWHKPIVAIPVAMCIYASRTPPGHVWAGIVGLWGILLVLTPWYMEQLIFLVLGHNSGELSWRPTPIFEGSIAGYLLTSAGFALVFSAFLAFRRLHQSHATDNKPETNA